MAKQNLTPLHESPHQSNNPCRSRNGNIDDHIHVKQPQKQPREATRRLCSPEHRVIDLEYETCESREDADFDKARVPEGFFCEGIPGGSVAENSEQDEDEERGGGAGGRQVQDAAGDGSETKGKGVEYRENVGDCKREITGEGFVYGRHFVFVIARLLPMSQKVYGYECLV